MVVDVGREAEQPMRGSGGGGGVVRCGCALGVVDLGAAGMVGDEVVDASGWRGLDGVACAVRNERGEVVVAD